MNRLTHIASAALTVAAATAAPAAAQEVALKTNLLYDATATVSVGAEVMLAPKWSLEVSGNINFWDMPHDRKWKHWLIQPEARYWLCEAMHGHFFGIHAIGVVFNVGGWGFDHKVLGIDFPALRHERSQGWGVGGGLNYGYSWILGKHWNIEAEIGLGYIYAKYDQYSCVGCGHKIDSGRHKNYFGPTEAAVNLVYIF